MSDKVCESCRNVLLDGEETCSVCGSHAPIEALEPAPALPAGVPSQKQRVQTGRAVPNIAELETGVGTPIASMETGVGTPIASMETGVGTPLASMETGAGGPPNLVSMETGAPGTTPPGPSVKPPAPPKASVRMRQSAQPMREADGAVPAELLARFEVVKLLGKGGMGAVTLCRDRQLGRDVAIKVVLQRSEKMEGLLLQEAQVLASLEHENIVRLYDLGTAGGLPYLVMELVRGKTLAQRLAAGPVSVLQAVRFARDIVTGVKVAHDKGVIHFDIKPGNVFLDENGRAKVADFGLAQLARGGDEKEGLFYFVGGTPAYMPLEQRHGAAGKPADVYACGVVFNEMLTGRPTFPARTETELREMKEGPIARPSSVNPRVPAVFDELVIQSLSVDPVARPTVEEFSKVLEEWLDRVNRQQHRAGGAAYPAHPYRFLEWFDVADAPIFFGRDGETQELTELVARPNVRAVSVFGPCGIGKSSVLRAGLARAVDPRAWDTEVILGGPRPARRILETLVVRAVKAGLALPGEVDADSFVAEPRLVNFTVSELTRNSGKGLVLVLDQTEEVFTQNPSDSPEPAALFALLAGLAEDGALPVKLVVAYRTEFRGDFYPLEQRLGPRIAAFPLSEIQEAGLVEAIEGPSTIEHYHFGYEPGLASRLAREILASARANRTSALPTLQIVCRQLHERMREAGSHTISWGLYESLGGAQGALERYVQGRLSDPAYAHQGAMARQILEALTVKDGERERFACARDEAEVLDFPDKQQAMQTLDQLIADRLVVRDLADGRRTVRLTSEVICPTIDSWAQTPDPTQIAARELARAHRLWVEHGRGADYLLSPRQLVAVRAALPALRGVSADEHAFVERSADKVRAGRIASALVALVVLALAGGWGWSTFFRPGRVKLASRPPGARVRYGGEELGVTPLTFERRPGVYALTLDKGDHDPVESIVQVRPGGETATTEILSYTKGLLQVVTDPPGAEVAIAPGGAVFRTPVTTEFPRGTYELSLSLPGYETKRVPNVLVEGDRQLTLKLVRLVRDTGSVVARSTREGTRLVLTDPKGRVVLEESLPLRAPAQLPAGQYTAEVGNPQGRVDFLSVTVTPRTTLELSPWVPAVSTPWTVRNLRATNPAGLADLDQDGATDLVLGTSDGFVRAISGLTGHEIWHAQAGGRVQCTPALADLDRDGLADAVVTSHDGRTYAISGRTGALLWSHAGRGRAQVNPASADLDGDGVPDVVTGSASGAITALRGGDGAVLWTVQAGGPVFADPKLVDFTGDGRSDVIVGANDKVLRAIDGRDGKILWTHAAAGVIGGAVMVEPLDGDAVPDVVVIDAAHVLTALSGATGKVLWTAPGVDGVAESIGDVDGDGVPDGACVAATYQELRAFSGKTGKTVWSLPFSSNLWPIPQVSGGTIVVASPAQIWVVGARDGRPRWGLRPGGVMTAPPTLADTDGDGVVDLVPVMTDVLISVSGRLGDVRWAGVTAGLVGSRPALAGERVIAASQDRRLRAFDLASGALAWSFEAGSPIVAGPALADLDGDRVVDAVITTADGRVQAISGTGTKRLWERDPGGLTEDCPRLVDLDGDGVPDVIAGTGAKAAHALSGATGEPLWTAKLTAEVDGETAVADLDGDRHPDVVVATADGAVHALSGASGRALWISAAPAPASGYPCGPAVADLDGDGVPDVVAAGENGAVRALSGKDGRQLWMVKLANGVRAGPGLRPAQGVPDVVLASSDGWLHCLSGKDGASRWVRKLPEGQTTPEAPVFADGDVWLTHGGDLLAFDGATGRPLLRTPERFTEAAHPLLIPGQKRMTVVHGATGAVVARSIALPVPAPVPARRLWTCAAGAGITASPALVGGTSVIAALDGRVYAVDARGAPKWTRAVGAPCGASPALDDARVIVGTTAGRVLALDAATGVPRWDVDAGAPVVASPVVTGAVFVATRGARLLALDRDSGKVKWSGDLAAPAIASPAAADLDGDRAPDVVAASDDGALRAFRGADGKPLWTAPVGKRIRSSPAVVPTTSGSLVVVGAGDKRAVALDGRTGAVAWTAELSAEGDSSPAVGDVDGDGALEVVIGANDGSVRALGAGTGKLLWTARAGPRTLGRPAIGDLDGDGRAEVVVGSADGELYLLDGATGRRLRVQGCGAAVDWSSPALADLDGDGALEIVVGSQAGALSAYAGLPPAPHPVARRAEPAWSFTSGRVYRR